MSAETFALHLQRTRDRGLPIERSWFIRHGGEEEDPCYFQLWATMPFEETQPDDLLWYLFAAAADEEATHLLLHVFAAHCPDPDDTFIDLLEEFQEKYGFWPFEFEFVYQDLEADPCTALLISLFSVREGMHGAGIYEAEEV